MKERRRNKDEEGKMRKKMRRGLGWGVEDENEKEIMGLLAFES